MGTVETLEFHACAAAAAELASYVPSGSQS
jgi:hypothetical protein